MTSSILSGQQPAVPRHRPASWLEGLNSCAARGSFLDDSILFGFTLMRISELAIAGCGKHRVQPASNFSMHSLHP
jgi:hypothetical protein